MYSLFTETSVYFWRYMEQIKVGIIGFGTVGSGVVRGLLEQENLLERKLGLKIKIAVIADKDITTPRKIKVDPSLLTTDVDSVINDPDVPIIVELIGGINPARQIILKALDKGKYVVTANKKLLAEEGADIFKKAVSKDNIRFEASVGGGIPIIKTLREGLVANRVNSIVGIVNGTCNFILSQMQKENCSFQSALEEAKQRGYAESDPALDISGLDSAHKIAVLASLAFGRIVQLKDITVEGIGQISSDDIRNAKELGFCIKLLGITKRAGNSIEARVHPALLPSNHLLSSVTGVFNAIWMDCDLTGEILMYGQGAGSMPTASAVISDIVDIVGQIKSKTNKLPALMFDPRKTQILPLNNIKCRHYIRFSAIDKPGVLSTLSGLLGKHNISIASVFQKERRKHHSVPLIMLTHEAKDIDVKRSLRQIDKLDIIRPPSVNIRIEEGE
jgi:homoserine dehydrogenase